MLGFTLSLFVPTAGGTAATAPAAPSLDFSSPLNTYYVPILGL